MRGFLERLYTGAGYLAGACLVAMVLLVLAQVVGRWFGVIIPSTEDFSGYLLAASTFLSLAYTFRQGGHIRVSLAVRHLRGRARRAGWLMAIAVFALVAAWGAYYATWLVIESWQFGELSQGYIPVPLWIPQLPMAMGLILLAVALLDELLRVVAGAEPGFAAVED